MNLLHLLALIPAMLGLAASESRSVSSITVEQTTVFRIPVRPHPPMTPMIEWQEHKGPKCLPAASLAGAMLAGRDAIDFITRDRQRFRARIDDDCTALDFYDGFYVQPQDDRLCARRDEIRSRMGASCRIEKFRTLIPAFRR
ncbi:MAG: hypothetical protein ABR588_07675 [Sphingomicrobium sp.]|nr:hypothetical protein [Sphingomonadales bacterium]